MPAVAFNGGMLSGHGCFHPHNIVGGVSTVMVTGKVIACKDASNSTPHSCPKVPPHASPIGKGSSTVFAGGFSVARIGDSTYCGSTIAQGASTVFAGG